MVLVASCHGGGWREGQDDSGRKSASNHKTECVNWAKLASTQFKICGKIWKNPSGLKY